MVADNVKGLILAVSSSSFIGVSFILKKKGLLRAAASGTRAGSGGYAYLQQPLWWAGMITMIVGEVANFVAYVYAPAVLVTPLGALSIIISATLAHFILKERLSLLGIMGCLCCIVGSVVIVLHAPEEESPSSVLEIWELATQPAFFIYVVATISIVVALILQFEPRCGNSNVLVYIGICSLIGSLTVVSIKAVGIAIKLTLEGMNQFIYLQTWFFLTVAAVCVVVQLNYLNKIACNCGLITERTGTQVHHHNWNFTTCALDTFSAAIVSPVYYVAFTTLTIVASAIMFRDWSGQDATSIASEICGFIIVLAGTVVLHTTRKQEQGPQNSYGSGEAHKSADNEEHLIAVHNGDYFR